MKLQKNCGVDTLKMSDYGIKPEEVETLAKNAKDTLCGLFPCDRIEISIDDCIAIYRNSYK